MTGLFIISRREQIAQENRLTAGIRQLDPDGVAALHHSDASRTRAHIAGNIVGQSHNTGVLDACRRGQFVKRHHRAGANLIDDAAHAEFGQYAFQHAGILA